MRYPALVSVLVVCLIDLRALADTHYASTDGGDVHPYTSPERAARDIQDALDAAEAGDTVRVLPGTYFRSVDSPYAVGDYVEVRGSGPGNTWVIGVVATGDSCRIRGFRFTGRVSLCTNELWRSEGRISDCVFDGGGLLAGGVESDISVTRCIFTNVPSQSSAVCALYTGMSIADSVFDLGDRAGDGVTFDELPTPAVIRNCRFTGCRRAITVGCGDTEVVNCLFTDNDVGVRGLSGSVRLENCTFYRNGCAVLTFGGLEAGVIKNSIIWGNDRGIIEYYSRRDYFDSTWKEERAMPAITFSLLETNVWWTYPGRGNTRGDPKFFSPEFDPELHLYPDSPCVDAGDPFSDYSNEPEPNGGRVNMGAYGNLWEATRSELVDTDADNMRDDWEMENFGTLDADGSGDADHDGLSDRGEYRYLSDPNNPDSDGDGLPDGEEVSHLGTDPILADTDNDGTPDGQEVAQGTNPLDSWDAFTVIRFWIEKDQMHVLHPVQPRQWYVLEYSYRPEGRDWGWLASWQSPSGIPTHTFVLDCPPHLFSWYKGFFRVSAKPYP